MILALAAKFGLYQTLSYKTSHGILNATGSLMLQPRRRSKPPRTSNALALPVCHFKSYRRVHSKRITTGPCWSPIRARGPLHLGSVRRTHEATLCPIHLVWLRHCTVVATCSAFVFFLSRAGSCAPLFAPSPDARLVNSVRPLEPRSRSWCPSDCPSSQKSGLLL